MSEEVQEKTLTFQDKVKLDYEQAKFDLFLTLFRGADSFSAQLYRLFEKADLNNRARLGSAFPIQYKTWLDWQNSPNERDFFKEYLIPISTRELQFQCGRCDKLISLESLPATKSSLNLIKEAGISLFCKECLVIDGL